MSSTLKTKSCILFFLFLFFLFLLTWFNCLSSSLYSISLVVFHLYNELRHTHKQEMDLSTHDCTSSFFCHLFTDPCWGRTSFFSIWIWSNFILFYFILLYFISFYLNLLFFISYHMLIYLIFSPLFIFVFFILFNSIQLSSVA